MNVNLEVFPERQALWEGALLGSVVHAIMMARYPELSHEQSWDGLNYNVQDSMGSRGTVSFSKRHVVGAFFDAKSPRNPFQSNEPYVLESALRRMPGEHRRLAEAEALQYLLQEYQGKTLPVVTAIFWNEGSHLESAEPWRQVFEHGAHLIRTQFLPLDTALEEWKQSYGMTSSQVELARALFELKLQKPEGSIPLDDQARAVIQSTATNPEAIEVSRESFAELGFILP